MKISNRKNKKYSKKLFNELVLMYLLSMNGFFFEYEALQILKISKRTLLRYIDDIDKTRILSYTLKHVIYNDCKLYHFNPELIIKDNDENNRISEFKDIGFVQEHPAGLDSDDKHIVKLTRCTILLHIMIHRVLKHKYDYFDGEDNNYQITPNDIYDIAEFYFERVDKNLSSKTYIRDIRICWDVLTFMDNK